MSEDNPVVEYVNYLKQIKDKIDNRVKMTDDEYKVWVGFLELASIMRQSH